MGNNATKKDKMRVTQRRREFKQNEEKEKKKDEKSRKGKDDTHKPDYPITEVCPLLTTISLFDRVSSSSIESS